MILSIHFLAKYNSVNESFNKNVQKYLIKE